MLTTLAGIAGLALITFLVDPLRDAVAAALRGDTRRGARLDPRPRRRRAADRARPLPDPHGALVSGGDRRRRRRASSTASGRRLGAGDARLAAQRRGPPTRSGTRSGTRSFTACSGRERFERAVAMVARGGVTLLLAVRLVPIFPFSVDLLRRRRRPGPALALHLDDDGRLHCRSRRSRSTWAAGSRTCTPPTRW